MFRLDNKVAIITGGGSGIGKAIASVFSKQGADVYILDMDEQGSIALVKEIVAAGAIASFRKCDVSNQSEVKNTIKLIVNETSSIQILVNNAGIAHIGNAEN